jgi:DNA polymerase-3 subunit epsilon
MAIAFADVTDPTEGIPDDLPLSAVAFAVVDVETTGMSPLRGDRITEFAAVGVLGERVAPLVHSLVDPGRPIPVRIQVLTGITDRMVAGAPRFGAIAHRVATALAARVFVAHNAAFDWAFVSHELAGAGHAPASRGALCTVRLARRVLPQLPRRSLDHVTAHYGVRIADRHRAAGDAEATAVVLQHLLSDVSERHGVSTWGALQAFLASGTSRARRGRSALPRAVDVDSFDSLP